VFYEWDAKKAKANWRKHGVSFDEAASVFLDQLAVTFPDPDHSGEEFREITIGHSARQRVIFLCHARRGDRTRLISARKATRKERRQYEESISKEN
jgi:uncharacterized protein